MRPTLVDLVITFVIGVTLAFVLLYALTLPDHVCNPQVTACE